MGESVEQVLQASMFTHSTLTQGEWVQVQHAGTQHDLKVLDLKPEAAVSIIGMSTHHCVIAGCSFVSGCQHGMISFTELWAVSLDASLPTSLVSVAASPKLNAV